MNTAESTNTNILKKVYAETSKVACEIFQKKVRHQLGRFRSFITWNYLKNVLTENIKVKEITTYKHVLTLHMRLKIENKSIC